MKLKDYVGLLIAIITVGLIIYVSVVEPIFKGISENGLPGFIIKVIAFIPIIYIVIALYNYNGK